MTNDTLDYFDEYRQKIQEKVRLQSKERDLTMELERIRAMRSQINDDLVGMQRLITVMIENNWDPVEAKLKTDSADRQRSFWNMPIEEDIVKAQMIQKALGISITGSQSYGNYSYQNGATGAIGAAAGAYGCTNTGLVTSTPTMTMSGAYSAPSSYPSYTIDISKKY